MSKHTPGPWTIEPCVEDHGESMVITARGIGIICRSQPDDDGVFSTEIDQANATLISAAPELLLSCELEAMLPITREEDGVKAETLAKAMGWKGELSVAAFSWAYRRAAIAKARGATC